MTDENPLHNPFASLAPLRGEPQPAAPEPDAPAAAEVPSAPPVARAVVRLERSGRRGKEVTVVAHLGLTDAELGDWLRTLKSALGCGGAVEGPAIVLQGDQRKRLPQLLTARGVRRVTIG